MANPRARQRAKPAREALAVDQQRDARDGAYRERGPSDRMRMPHERDESAAGSAGSSPASPAQSGLMEQAHQDLEGGLQDTDCRGAPDLAQTDCPPRSTGAPARREATGAKARSGSRPARRRHGRATR